MRTLHPPELGGHPLIDRLLYSRRLDHQLARVDKLGQLLLLLQRRLQLDRPHPVEGGPHRAPLAALLLELLKSLPPYAPVLADLKARQLPLLAPPVDCGLLHPDHPGDVRGRQKLRLSKSTFAVLHALLVPASSDALVSLVAVLSLLYRTFVT